MNSNLSPLETGKVFQRCVEDCFEPIMITDQRGALRYVNPAWCLTYGYSSAEALGQTPRLLRSSQQDETFYRAMWATILDPKVGFWRGEVTNRAKDGHLVPVILTITPYREDDGRISGYMGIAVDLTEQKRMESQILRQDRLASVGMLASGLAHEIGNPLGVMRGRAELLLSQMRAAPQADNFPAVEKNIEVIVGQIDRISRLIQSLLRSSRVPEKLALREVNLATVVQEVGSLMSESLRQSGIDFVTSGLNHTVLADPNHLEQVLLNLMINSTHAIAEQIAKSSDASSGGERSLASGQHRIEVVADADNGASVCRLRVRDTGCGVARENLERIFQPFFTTKGAGVGTGLGLAIVAKLIDEMQGQISVDSDGVGRGVVFTITLQRPLILK
jgi:PAS domain S-box-containing protein